MRSIAVKSTEVNTEKGLKTRRFRELGVLFRLSDFFIVHTVVKGDTLWDIAVKYLGKGSRYTEIKKLNGLSSNVIYSGWKLKIPN